MGLRLLHQLVELLQLGVPPQKLQKKKKRRKKVSPPRDTNGSAKDIVLTRMLHREGRVGRGYGIWSLRLGGTLYVIISAGLDQVGVRWTFSEYKKCYGYQIQRYLPISKVPSGAVISCSDAELYYYYAASNLHDEDIYLCY